MRLFRQDNTEGYSDEQLDRLNTEWEQRVADMDLEPGAEYDFQAKAFSDEVSRRELGELDFSYLDELEEEIVPDEEVIDLSEVEEALRKSGLF